MGKKIKCEACLVISLPDSINFIILYAFYFVGKSDSLEAVFKAVSDDSHINNCGIILIQFVKCFIHHFMYVAINVVSVELL